MPERLNIGVIGLGRMGRLYARTITTQVAGVQLYAVAEPDAQARAVVVTAFPVPHVFADPVDLLALPDLDAVVIATPTSTHHERVITAAQAGKAIFSEKPLAISLADTHAALAAVAQYKSRITHHASR